MKDTIAIVTGATRGLGYATAIALAARGAHVIAIGRTVGGLEELDDVISDAGGSCTLTPMDLNDDPGLERLGAAIYQRWGHVDLMVHAAAEAAPLSPAEHIAAKDLDKAITANFRIIQRLIRVTQPLLKAAKSPQAVFIADPETEGARFNGAYGASKAAGRALVQSWAAEQARLGPRVWLAAPPPMATAIRARGYPGEDRTKHAQCSDVAERIVAKIAEGGAASGETLTF